MKNLIFIVPFFIGILLPFLFWKANPWLKWITAFVLGILSIVFIVIAKTSPSEGLSDLGYIVMFLLFALATIGNFFGALIVVLIKKAKS